MNRTAVFRYPVDLRVVTIVALAFAMSVVPFLLSMPLWVLVPYLAIAYVVRTYTPFAQHNQGHLPVFNNGALNWLYDAVLAQCTGYPTALWELHHNRGHHRNFLTPERDVARVVDLKTGSVMSRWMYALRGNLTIHRDAIRIALAERAAGKKTLLPKLGVETAVHLAVTAAALWWNPWMAVWCVIIPNLFAAWFIWWESYPHHLHVPTKTIYDGSVTITSPSYNRHTFNIGHHTAHHEKPTLHWSLLPERTARILDRIPPMCVHERYDRRARRQAEETLRKTLELERAAPRERERPFAGAASAAPAASSSVG